MIAAQSNRIPLAVAIGIGNLGIGMYCNAAPTPCSLVTTAEEKAVRKFMRQPKADQEGSAAWCSYEFANGKDAIQLH